MGKAWFYLMLYSFLLLHNQMLRYALKESSRNCLSILLNPFTEWLEFICQSILADASLNDATRLSSCEDIKTNLLTFPITNKLHSADTSCNARNKYSRALRFTNKMSAFMCPRIMNSYLLNKIKINYLLSSFSLSSRMQFCMLQMRV